MKSQLKTLISQQNAEFELRTLLDTPDVPLNQIQSTILIQPTQSDPEPLQKHTIADIYVQPLEARRLTSIRPHDAEEYEIMLLDVKEAKKAYIPQTLKQRVILILILFDC